MEEFEFTNPLKNINLVHEPGDEFYVAYIGSPVKIATETVAGERFVDLYMAKKVKQTFSRGDNCKNYEGTGTTFLETFREILYGVVEPNLTCVFPDIRGLFSPHLGLDVSNYLLRTSNIL